MSQQLTASLARAVLRWPRALLALLLLAGAVLVARLPQLDIDVSSRTLLGIDHPALKAWRETAEVFHLPEQVMVTVAAPGGLRNAANRALLDKLQKDLAAVPDVAAVTSVLDAPLVTLVPGPLARLESNRRTLRDKDIDLGAARHELLASPLFAGVLTGDQGRVNLLRVRLAPDLDAGAEAGALAGVRAVLGAHSGEAELGLAGTPALAAETRAALNADLRRLPGAVLAVMLLLIGLGTRRPPALEFLCGAHALVTCAGAWQLAAGAVDAGAPAPSASSSSSSVPSLTLSPSAPVMECHIWISVCAWADWAPMATASAAARRRTGERTMISPWDEYE